LFFARGHIGTKSRIATLARQGGGPQLIGPTALAAANSNGHDVPQLPMAFLIVATLFAFSANGRPSTFSLPKAYRR
jgi:hypothetical protein